MSFHVNVESIDAAIERLTMHGGTGLMGSRGAWWKLDRAGHRSARRTVRAGGSATPGPSSLVPFA
jgi:hypothetical protein